jgi:hypothetical protein
MFTRILLFFVVALTGTLFLPDAVVAGPTYFTSDLITDSTPAGTSTMHTVTFNPGLAIPTAGKIMIIPEPSGGGVFTVPPALNLADITLEVSTGGGPFVARPLALLPSGVSDGVTVTTGVNGFITFDLATGVPGIAAGDTVKVTIGGANFITSPAVQGSYRIRIRTFDAASLPLDVGTAMIAIVERVTVTGDIQVIVPLRSNGLPTGLLPGATTNVLVSLNTDIPAFCKYATTSGVDFFAMSSTTIFLDANAGLLHYINVPVFENDIFTYYLRCVSSNGNPNPDDYVITFEIGVIPNASTTPLPPPPPPTPSGPSGGGGGGGLFLKGGDVTISGTGIPGGALTILKDGKIAKEDQVSVTGSFTNAFTQLDRGTYTWGVYVKDPDGNLSSTYNSTIYLIGGTNNIIAPVYLSPTIKAATTTVPIGGSLLISGYGIPLTTVQAIMNKQGDVLNSKIITGTTTSNGNGSWKMVLSTEGLKKGTYEVKAQSLVTTRDQSVFSPTLYIGVGENPNPNFKNRADLNKDGKVNLVDFSILLFNWKTSDAVADINQDGTVSLIDFSIMLANWTG